MTQGALGNGPLVGKGSKGLFWFRDLFVIFLRLVYISVLT